MSGFFVKEENLSVLGQFVVNLAGLTNDESFEGLRNKMIALVLGEILRDPAGWDRYCSLNIEWIGPKLIRSIGAANEELNKKTLDDVCAMAFRFLLEFYLSKRSEVPRELESARRFVEENLDRFEENAKNQIMYATVHLPIEILKTLISSDAINSMMDYNLAYKQAMESKKKWDEEIAEKEVRVNSLKQSLEKFRTAYNFVGLYQGFDELSLLKSRELSRLTILLWFLSVMVVSPIVAELIVIYLNLKNIGAVKEAILYSVLPVSSLVAISIYYFRVVLLDYRSVKSQILQIELRKTLCRFIQDYAKYSKEIKENNGDSLDKFENIIFSGIVSDAGNIPSTYDGIEQLGKLVKAIKS